MLRLGLLGLVMIAACGGAQIRPHKPGQEYLSGIRLEGNASIDADDLVPGLGLQRNAERQLSVDDYQLQLDTQRIATAYQKRGFFAVQVHSKIEKHGDAATVVFVIQEGPRATTHIEIQGLPPDIPITAARDAIKLREGGPFDYDAFDDAKEPLLRLVEDAGYAHARMEASVIADRTHAHATVRYAFDPGPSCVFGEVTIQGAEGMLADAVRARLRFHPGDRYSAAALESTQQALYAFGRFASVRVDADRAEDKTVIPVKLSLVKGDANELRAGIGAGIDPLNFFGHVRLQYARMGFLTPLTNLNLDARPEYGFELDNCSWNFLKCKRDPRVRVLGVLTQQDLFFPDVKGDVELGLDYVTIEAYTKAGAHARVGLATPLGTPHVQLRVGWQYAVVDFLNPTIDTGAQQALGITTTNYIGAYTGALVLDFRDHPLEPHQGVYAEFRIAKGTALAGGDFDYLQVTPEVRGFYTLLGTVLAIRGRLGTITGDVPATERYFGGGVTSHRGFSSRRLSPYVDATSTSPDGIVVGGAGLFEGSVELRHGLGSPWGIDLGGVWFLDAGEVTPTPADLDVHLLQYALGFGLRWVSPIGPVGIDFAYRLNHAAVFDPEPTRKFNWLIAIGEAF